MGWQLVNSLVRPPYPDTAGGVSWGYLVGTGDEEGYYCFRASPYFASPSATPFISDTFLPRIRVDGDEMDVAAVTYADQPVWGPNPSGYYFFKARTRYGDWVRLGQLREPSYHTDIDGTTVVGDKFYEGAMPALNGGTVPWTIAGAYTQQEEGDTIDVELVQDVWLWHDNGDRTLAQSQGFCGRYYNLKADTWKSVGVPAFEASGDVQGCHCDGEVFLREAGRDWDGNHAYAGTRHRITKQSGVWVMGTRGQGEWSEAGTEPGKSDVHFTGYAIDGETGRPAADPLGDFTLSWTHLEMGNGTGQVLMGEVSLWRPQ